LPGFEEWNFPFIRSFVMIAAPDPWHRNASCPEDFLMIAEFSELEGPKPLVSINHSERQHWFCISEGHGMLWRGGVGVTGGWVEGRKS
jgi:hypothetical protein